MQKVISQIRRELNENIDPKHKEGGNRFFKGTIKNYGVKTGIVRRIANKYFTEIKGLTKDNIFKLVEELLQSDYMEEAIVAFHWVFKMKAKYQREDFVIFEKWLNNYVSNWAKCDDFCTHSFGSFILQFPDCLPQIKKTWIRSPNRWLRRGAAVILIPAIKKNKKFLQDVFDVAEILLMDKDDLVQKGYGWLLKEASNKYQKEVFDFVMKRKNWMPRTALRYAIEKMPEPMRKQAMSR